MTINELLKEKKISVYRLAKISGIPYATLNDIRNGKTDPAKCSAETIYRLSEALDISMEEIIRPYLLKRYSFELFKSNVCHRLKNLGDIDFLIETLEQDKIRDYFDRKWYPECFYLLAMLDYISRINNIPICNEYNDIRKLKLSEPIYPSGIIALATLFKSNTPKQQALKESIPEFLHFNIVESEIRNVI